LEEIVTDGIFQSLTLVGRQIMMIEVGRVDGREWWKEYLEVNRWLLRE
jgi:hypothetical protein